MTNLQSPCVRSCLRAAEWPTLLVLIGTYVLWAVATTLIAEWSITLAVLLCALTAAQHSSLQHEVLHGHPFRSDFWNALLVFPALGVAVPYLRFRDTHLAHHHDENLTDPYDDPETNYLDPVTWADLPGWRKTLYNWNNTLSGRLVLGPIIGQVAFMRADWSLIRAGDTRVLVGWLLHIPAVAIVLWWMSAVAALPIWAWLLSVYLSLSVLKLRTYLEHQAHDTAHARTAIVEDRGLFALLFLNNNLHVVHHRHPGVPWYALPAIYRGQTDMYLAENQGYRYRNYAEIARKYLFRAKDPVPHPIYRGGQSH